ncbi:2875_t:CDS:2, partial [Scutellospora calospora]
TSQTILNASLSSANSISELSFDAYFLMLIHVPLNPNMASISNELYENYLTGTNLNVNNAFNNQTSPNLPFLNTNLPSNILTSIPLNSFHEMNFQRFNLTNKLNDLNSVFTQEHQTFFNINDLNLHLINSSYNENNVASFERNQITENTPIIQSNNYNILL